MLFKKRNFGQKTKFWSKNEILVKYLTHMKKVTYQKRAPNTTFQLEDFTRGSCSVVVITLASHARGLRFEPGQEHTFFCDFFYPFKS